MLFVYDCNILSRFSRVLKSSRWLFILGPSKVPTREAHENSLHVFMNSVICEHHIIFPASYHVSTALGLIQECHATCGFEHKHMLCPSIYWSDVTSDCVLLPLVSRHQILIRRVAQWWFVMEIRASHLRKRKVFIIKSEIWVMQMS
jgi:hypothetical protein